MSRPLLRPMLEAQQVERVWARLSQTNVQARRRRGLMLAAAAAVLLVAAGVYIGARSQPLLEVGEQIVAQRTLTDGTLLSPSEGARLEVLLLTKAEVRTLQRDGRCRYSIAEKRDRKWTVETTLGTIEVLGTIFTVDVRDNRLHVDVERGHVFVRAAGAVASLRAGESITLPPVAVVVPAPVQPQASPEPLTLPPASVQDRPRPVDRPRPARALPEVSRPQSAPRAEVESPGAGASPSQLEAWLRGRPEDNDWAVVALRLATLELEHDRPAAALSWLERVLEYGQPSTVIEDAAARRIEALAALGRRDAASEASRQFRRRWPASAWLPRLQYWLE